MSSTLAGRTAVVTGAGRGLGRAIAVALARSGASRIVLVARSAAQLDDAASDVRRVGAEAVVVAADLARPDTVGEWADLLGPVDVLINNAATVAPLGNTATLAATEIEAAFRLNSVSPIVLAGRIVPGMVERGWGRVVAVSSGIVSAPSRAVGSGVYAATKSALEAHVLALAAELDGTGVTANVYRPGVVDTSMQQWVREQDPAVIGSELHGRFVENHRSGTLLPPERSAEVLVSRLEGFGSGEVWDVSDPA